MKNPIICLLLFLSLSVQAQKKKSNTTTIEATKPILDSVFKNLQWRNIGPFFYSTMASASISTKYSSPIKLA